MEILKCLVIDDEPLAIQLLEDHIQKTPFLSLSGTFTNPMEALLHIGNNPVDLVFLDIQMPQLNGVQFLEMLRKRAAVIITSAYEQYAISGYEHDVVDYLLKPISFERFFRAAEKAYKSLHPIQDGSSFKMPETSRHGGYIFVKVETRMVRVELDDILYLEGLKNYIAIHTRQNKILVLQLMKQMEESLPSNRFVRIHKSYIIALDKIDSVEKQEIKIGNIILPIGASYAEHFNKMLNKYKA